MWRQVQVDWRIKQMESRMLRAGSLLRDLDRRMRRLEKQPQPQPASTQQPTHCPHCSSCTPHDSQSTWWVGWGPVSARAAHDTGSSPCSRRLPAA